MRSNDGRLVIPNIGEVVQVDYTSNIRSVVGVLVHVNCDEEPCINVVPYQDFKKVINTDSISKSGAYYTIPYLTLLDNSIKINVSTISDIQVVSSVQTPPYRLQSPDIVVIKSLKPKVITEWE